MKKKTFCLSLEALFKEVEKGNLPPDDCFYILDHYQENLMNLEDFIDNGISNYYQYKHLIKQVRKILGDANYGFRLITPKYNSSSLDFYMPIIKLLDLEFVNDGKRSFISKMTIALKAAGHTIYGE